MFAKALSLCFIFIQFSRIENKESVYIINGKKPLNVISERFLSFSIEPNDFLENLNDVQYTFQHLKPAFIRIAGRSTKTIQFSAENSSFSSESKYVITPLVWKQVYRWFVSTGLTPVFSINNNDGVNDTWNPEILRPIFETNEEIGFNCYWEMGYDCDTKFLPKYQEDLKSLKHVIERYPTATIVGGNTYSCANTDLARKVVEELNGTVEAIVWETFARRNVIPMNEMPTWIIMHQAKYPETFASALQWARFIAESASSGYKIMFWKTSVKSLPDSAPFWIALLHKRLVGQTVLDISTNSRMQYGVEVCAYCAKQYSAQGALVLFIVNDGTNNFTVPILVASLHPQTIEVQSYIVTSDNGNIVYLNGEKLSRYLLNTDHLIFIPKLQTFQVQTTLNLNVPPKSVSFFVLPRAGMSICGYSTETKDEILLPSRFNPTDSTKLSRLDVFKQKLEELKLRNDGQRKFGNSKVANDFNDFLAHKHKAPKLKNDKTSKLEIIFSEKPLKGKINSDYPRQIALELTNDEIKQILLERAKSRIEENNMSITNKELERTMKRATANVQKYKRFATIKPLKRRSNSRLLRGKKHVKRDTGTRQTQKFENGGNVFADFAPANYGERDADDTNEDVLRSGEQFVDERLKFLKDRRNGDSEIDEKSEYSIYEDFGSNNREDQLEFIGELNPERNREGMRWMQHARAKRDTRPNIFKSKIDSKNRINHVIVKKRQNTDRDIAAKLKNLKEKVENRIKMNNWIRNKQKQNLQESRSRRMTANERNAFAYYTPKVLNGRLARDNNVKIVKKMPSYSREEVVEFLPNKMMKRRSERALTDVDTKENLIDDESSNKITKMKAPMESVATPRNIIATTEIPIYNSTKHVSFNKEESEGGKSFFQAMVEQVATFIENMYGKVSGYFTG